MEILWWQWMSVGIVILLTEAITPGGFYLLFIGGAALIVGAVSPTISSTSVEIALFALLSALLIILCRKPLVRRLRLDTPSAETPEFIGESATTVEAILVGQQGRIEMRGTTWQARNGDSVDLPAKALCVVQSREGLGFVVTLKRAERSGV